MIQKTITKCTAWNSQPVQGEISCTLTAKTQDVVYIPSSYLKRFVISWNDNPFNVIKFVLSIFPEIKIAGTYTVEQGARLHG